MSSEQVIVGLIDDEIIQQQVEEVWNRVFNASATVIEHAKQFGFEKMGIVPDPNIHTILTTLRIFNVIIDSLLASAEELDEPFANIRVILNTKQQLLCMEMVANALKANDKETYEQYLRQLKNQGSIWVNFAKE